MVFFGISVAQASECLQPEAADPTVQYTALGTLGKNKVSVSLLEKGAFHSLNVKIEPSTKSAKPLYQTLICNSAGNVNKDGITIKKNQIIVPTTSPGKHELGTFLSTEYYKINPADGLLMLAQADRV